MKNPRLLLLLLIGLSASAAANDLPDLGDISQAAISPQEENRIGREIMREVRADRDFLDDAEVIDYLNQLGARLVAGSTESAQAFEFFALQDPAINAFALPGGFVGINTGLMLAAQSESELASVLAHEIAHVTQKHLARMIAGQKGSTLTSLAAIAVAILAARANPQAGQAALATAQATAIQSQLDFTRDHEKEADRIGLQILAQAKLDVHAMPVFFERMQKSGRFHEGSAPSYLRTHPLTFERIADIQNRTQALPRKMLADSIEFQLLRAKLRAAQGSPGDALTYFRAEGEAGAGAQVGGDLARHYGLVSALLRNRQYERAEQEMADLRKAASASGQNSALFDSLAARVKLAAGQAPAALVLYRAALQTYPQQRALVYAYADALLQAPQQKTQAATALKLVNQQLLSHPDDARLYRLQAQSYAVLGNAFLQHRAIAESYARLGNYSAAIDQLQIALKSSEPDFYQLSSTEARLREMRYLDEASRKADGTKMKY